jgi:hypothetical protein
MRSPSLERLYAQINKIILLAQSYTEVDDLAFIIRACRLKPYSYVFEERDNKITLHRWWFDEFGNSLKIVKNKRIKLVYNDLSLDRDKIVCTDLYHGFSMERLAKTSKLLHLCAGKDEDSLENCFFVTFLGIDNYLRSYMFLEDQWQQVSPLLLGMKQLKTIAKNRDIKYFREFSIKENLPLPCAHMKEWVTFMPASKDFLQLIRKEYDDTFSFLNKTKETQ